MKNLRVNLRKHNKLTVKANFELYPVESILWGLWQYRNELGLDPIRIAYTSTVAIEFSKPGVLKNDVILLDKSRINILVHLATDYCLNITEKKQNQSNSTNEIFYGLFSLMANQLGVSYATNENYARALLLFKVIPNKIGIKLSGLSLSDDFEIDRGYSIEDYLKTCFVAFAATMKSGRLTDDYLFKMEEVTNSPNFKTMNAVLSDISASTVHYRRERRRLNPPGSFRYQPLLIYPLIKPWSEIPKHQKRKRYMVPLPHLIATKASTGVYHYFLSKHNTTFTTVFGKHIFERYVQRTLDFCCHQERLIDGDQLKLECKIPSRVSIPDFLLVTKEQGIIVECKAAVLPLGVYTQGNMGDYTSTVRKIVTAVNQTANFENYALSSSLYGVKDWMRLVISYEPLWGINSDILSEILITDFLSSDETNKFKENFEDVLILSVSQLDSIQPFTSQKGPLHSILTRIKESSFNEVLEQLFDKSERNYKKCHLEKYIDQLLLSIDPDEN